MPLSSSLISQLLPTLNIFLTHILQTISSIKHPLCPQFMLPYLLVLRLKIVLCVQDDMELCFCVGCMLARRYRQMLRDNELWWGQIVDEMSKYEICRLRVCGEKKQQLQMQAANKEQKQQKQQQILSNLFTIKKSLSPKQYQQQIDNQLNILKQIYSNQVRSWQEDEQMHRFLVIFYLVCHVDKICQKKSWEKQFLVLLDQVKKQCKEGSKNGMLKLFQQCKEIF